MFRSSFYNACVVIGLSATVVMGCTHESDAGKKAENMFTQDRELGYDRDDYRNMMAPRPAPESVEQGSVPDLLPVIAENKKNILPQPLVSISVNQDVPVRDIFFELAKQAEVDLELDPTISGSIIFTAYNRPFDQVVERISDMAGLRYKFKNNVLRVERDTPYMKTYRMDYLSVQREYTSTISSNTSAATGSSGSSGGGGGGGSGSGENGSSSTITSTSSSDFWNELETNITQIIANTNRQVVITDQTARVTTPQAIPALPVADLTAISSDGTAAPNPAAMAQQQALAQMQNQIAAASAAPAIAGMANPSGQATAADASAGGTANPYFSVNRQAGLINIFATEKQHIQVTEYLIDLRRSINTQVLIEAKVFEVELNDENSLGIDWQLLGSQRVFGGISLPRQNFAADAVTATEGAIFTVNRGDFEGMISAISRFGTIRTLSSPRLTVMNNQTAVLNVSESRVFFTIEVERTEASSNGPATRTITSEINNVPEGVIITVHPSVDPDTHEITMNLRPSITRVVRTVSDPAVRMETDGEIESLIPELSIREIDSIIKMSSGSTVVMGGLMQDRVDSRQVGVPVLSEIPLLGAAFRNQRDSIRKTEMVILLRAVVVNNANPDATDRDFYRNMSQDRRPLPL